MTEGLLGLFSYLSGSVMMAVLIGRILYSTDPRAGGSGNPGATNMLRLRGRLPAALTLAGDMLKAVIPLLAARWLEQPSWVLCLCAVCVFLGHLYPVFFRFQGGKGVATLLGILIILDWRLGSLYAVIWLLTAALGRYSSLASLLAALAVLLTVALAFRHYFPAMLPITLLLVYRHRQNIRNLIRGTESRISFGN